MASEDGTHCPFVHLFFKSMIFPILLFWIKNMREGAVCACKPLCQVPDSLVSVGTLIKDLGKQATMLLLVVGFLPTHSFIISLAPVVLC